MRIYYIEVYYRTKDSRTFTFETKEARNNFLEHLDNDAYDYSLWSSYDFSKGLSAILNA